MKRWKQTLALLLCAVLCFTTLSASAFAAENWPEKTDPIAACFTSGSRDSATSTGKFPEYRSGRTTWTLSNGVLVISGTGWASNANDKLFDGNPYIETVIVKDGVTGVDSGMFKDLPNFKNYIVMNNSTDIRASVQDCPLMDNFIIGANLENNPMHSLKREAYDYIKVTAGGVTGVTGGGVSVVQPVAIANRVFISSAFSDFNTAVTDAKALIAGMKLPVSALALLPVELGGTFSGPFVSNWAQTIVTSAENRGLIPGGLGEDYTRQITRAQFAALAVRTYETLTGTALTVRDTSDFADCTSTSSMDVYKAYDLGIMNGYNRADRRWETYIGPHDPITREQAATMLARLAQVLGKPLSKAASTPFIDGVSDWAKDNVSRVYNTGIMTGTSATTFSASSNFTIEQSIIAMVRMADYVS